MHPCTIHLLAACTILASVGSLHAQADLPPRRAHHALVYDAARQRVMLTGGSTPRDGGNRFEFFNDLWAFDGVRWTALDASGDRLSGIRLVFDARRGQVLSFGGFDGRSRGDLRVLDGGAWRTLGQHTEMPAAEPGFVLDTRRNRLVAFGGSANRGVTNGDTWEFDGTSWARRATTNPPARQGHAMVFDERRARTVVFGGMGAAPEGQRPATLGDTWEFDGTTWHERPGPGPSARVAPGAAYDARRGLVILFGGSGAQGFLGDTWSWDGTTWRKLAESGPEPRAMAALAYDAARDRIVLFGGRRGYPDGDLNDTWEWDGTAWRRIAAP